MYYPEAKIARKRWDAGTRVDTGHVKSWDAAKDFGFIRWGGKEDLYFKRKGIAKDAKM